MLSNTPECEYTSVARVEEPKKQRCSYKNQFIFRFAVCCTQCTVFSKLNYFFAGKANIHWYSTTCKAASFCIQTKGKGNWIYSGCVFVHH